ncbi:hypothetical protein T492DRAFT_1138956 [Pavlovales sp. CCMP2436]|nr:hypothetical protein T492DRAFT_1138956 [Pavlovales sp. CCMP2436]|mmetsp:Transcript_3267/g.8135  ORF Transcript_3267/g.8135 Transcript_3267/m.8135 type:complete len:429 (+) Transcript_3267:3-1289(+)
MICGDDTGLCKRVTDIDGRVVVRWGEQARGAAVHRLCVRKTTLACGRADGSVDVYELLADSSAAPARAHSHVDEGRVQISGLAFCGDERLLVADVAGRIEVLRVAGGKSGESAAVAQAGGHTSQVRVDSSGSLAASSGHDHELRVWDLATMAVTWKARNVPEDMVRLAVPVWTTDLAFSPGTPHTLVTVSGLVEQRLRAEVRVYDVRVGRRPTMRSIAPLGDIALSALALTVDGQCALVGTAKGELGLLDLRRDGSLVGSYKGAGGAITAIELDSSRVYSTSLDRHVRVHSLRTRKQQTSAYLKQRQFAVAVLPGGTQQADEGADAQPYYGPDDLDDNARAASTDAADADAVAGILDRLDRALDSPAADEDVDEARAAAARSERKAAKRQRAATSQGVATEPAGKPRAAKGKADPKNTSSKKTAQRAA